MDEQQVSPHVAPTAGRDGAAPALTGTHVVIGAGPVGRAIAAVVAAAGGSATVLSRSGVAVDGARHPLVDVRQVDATQVDALAAVIAGADVVYQCAQPAYHRWPDEFPDLQQAVVEACARCAARLVVVENLYGYGPVDGRITPDQPLDATTRKGAVRAAMWHSLERAHAAGRVEVLAVRASDFIGPGVTASVFGERFAGAIVAGKPAETYGPTSVRHTVTYVPDLARTMVTLGSIDAAYGRAWHAPNEPAVTIAAVIESLARHAGTEPRTRRLRPWQLRLAGLFLPAAREMVELQYEFDRDFVVDDRATRERFGVTSTPLDVVFERTVDWYRASAG